MSQDRSALLTFFQQTISLSNELANTIANTFQAKSVNKGELFLSEGKVSDEYL